MRVTRGGLPDPPYDAVIFTSQRSEGADDTYAMVSDRMAKLAAQQPGYLGMTSFRDDDSKGVTISDWSELQAIENWREHGEHRLAREQGRRVFYDAFRLEICRVERGSEFARILKKEGE